MGKRGNEHGQARREEYESLVESSSDAPKGPFEKASEDVMKKRRIVRSARKFSKANQSSTPGTAGKGAFAGVSLTATPSKPFGGFSFGSPAAPAATKPSFSFGSSTPATTAPPASKPSFPAFATPAASSNPVASKSSTSTAPSGSTSKNDEKLIKCAQAFLEHMKGLQKVDMACYQQFLKTYSELSDSVKATTKAVTKSKATTSSTGSSWDSSRPLFGGSKPLTSPTAGSAPAPAPTTNLFGASSPSSAPAAGGFSFNPTKTGASPAPVPAFSFSTTPSAAVKEAAKTAAAETATKPEGAAEKEKKEEESGELEAANDDYKVLYKTKTKILHVSKNAYIKGVLKLEKNRENGKNRLVVRDAVSGRVKMNSAISKGMPLSKGVVPATKKKGPTPIVLIKAAFDENSEEPEDFKIITSAEEHENLYNELKKLV